MRTIVDQIGKHKSFHDILQNLDRKSHKMHEPNPAVSYARIVVLPGAINTTYIDQAPYWLTYFPYVELVGLFTIVPLSTVNQASRLLNLLRPSASHQSGVHLLQETVSSLPGRPETSQQLVEPASSVGLLAKSANGHSRLISSMRFISEYLLCHHVDM